MTTIRTERPVDAPAREALLDVAYGPARHAKPSARLRTGRLPAEGLSLIALERGRMIGTVRLWHVQAGRGRPALLLGPLAVHPAAQKRGIGAALMRCALDEAAKRGHPAVLLVGDLNYYGRFGLSAVKPAGLVLPGVDPARLLAIELIPRALEGAQGRIIGAGRREPNAALAALRRKVGRKAAPRLVPQAA
jgi:predicted N-acetyltransferase YhbS